MSARFDIIRIPALSLLVLLVAGCASSPPTNLYTLSAIGVPLMETAAPQSASAVVAIGPLVDDVALRLPSYRVVAFPLISEGDFDYRVAVDISRFDVHATGQATLAARWQLYARSKPRALQIAEDVLQRPSEGEGYSAYAASLSGVIADLSERIAKAVSSARASTARALAD